MANQTLESTSAGAGNPAPEPLTKMRSSPHVAPGEKSLVARPSTWLVWAGAAALFIFIGGILLSVVVDSFGKQWFTTWLPESFTTSWYSGAWDRFGMASVIGVTELIHAANNISSNNLLVMETLLAAAVWYMVVVTVAGVGQHYLERSFGQADRGPLSRAGKALRGVPLVRSARV